jgi:hypothetical protein
MRNWGKTGGALVILAFLLAVAGCSPAAAPLTSDELVAAMVTSVNAPDRTFHMDWQGTIGMEGGGMPAGIPQMNSSINGSFDFAGADFVGTMTTAMRRLPGDFDPGGFSTTMGMARVNGVAFMQQPGGRWERADAGMGDVPSLDPLVGLSAADIEYGAPETIDDQPLHRVRIIDPGAVLARSLSGGAPGPAMKPVGDDAEFVLYIDGQGKPVGGQARLTTEMDFGGMDGGFDGGLGLPAMRQRMGFTYQFSLWGEPIAVRAPI